ncbi:rhodanese [Lysobacteraceae bacterium NML120232]|nr:rhodanese [Xanthomonadaceae bacterium NML08-0793]PJK12999.1 rhodanese [Xanthomonadaceae bacterium NML120232]
MTVSAAELVAAARQRIREVSPGEFHQDRKAALLIDVREPAEFASGHLEGAVNIPRGVLEFQIDAHPAAGRDAALVIYCRTGGRAALAAESLQRLGFADVRSISGGIEAWCADGLPIITP